MTGIGKTAVSKTVAVICWLVFWQLTTVLVHNEIVFAGPVETMQALFRLAGTKAFHAEVLSSYLRVTTGFLAGSACGVILAIPAFVSETAAAFITPFIHLLKTVPVACFAVILLIMTGTSQTARLISGMVALPVVYTGVYDGLKSAGSEEVEIADMFTMTRTDRVKHIYIPAMYPFLLAALKLACGVSFKAGIAAEVIAQTAGSLGNDLYKAKVLLQTDALFAITVVVVMLSFLTEKAVVRIFRKWGKINEYE